MTTAAPPRSPVRTAPAPAPRPLSERAFRLGTAVVAAAAALFLAVSLRRWPPHEDEVLALFVGGSSLGDVLGTVLGERGGAPLHFLLAWAVSTLGGGLTELRLVSAALAVASVPLVAALGARLAGRAAGVGAAVLAAASWVFLFHGVYARMYSLFLCTSVLSYLLLLRAAERGGTRRWTAWAAAVLLTVASHPYGALVFASQGLWVLLARVRLREAVAAFGAVAVLGTPFWISDLVLAGRFDVGLGPGGEKLGSPLRVLAYLWRVAGDFSAGWAPATAAVLALAVTGAVLLARERPREALLVAAVVATPTLAFVVARLGRSAAPETRHLLFALPFFATLVALPLVRLGTAPRYPGPARAAALGAASLLVALEVGWAWSKTPELFRGEPAARGDGREAAGRWLARTARPGDVLLGYEPVFLAARERGAAEGRVLPRADPRLALRELRAGGRLGRGVWVFDAWDTNNVVRRVELPVRLPRPAIAFEARAFGPYLVVRTREPTGSPRRYLERAAAAQVLGRSLDIGDAAVNFDTVARAASRLGYSSRSPSSRSTSSR